MNILYQFNDKYAPYAGVSMTSLLENNKAAESIYIYVLGEELSDDSIGRLQKLVDRYKEDGILRAIIFLDTVKLIELMKELNMPTYRGSYAANMRLFVTELLIKAREAGEAIRGSRLLYMDADTIVAGDLSEIYNSDIKTVGMVYDTLASYHKLSIGLTGEDGYYNSGVILYDLDKWVANDFTSRIIEHVQKVRAQYPSPDQDLINVVVRNEISRLPFECNLQPHLKDYSYSLFMKVFAPHPFYSEAEISKALKQPLILHAFRYIGEFPWHKGNVHPFNNEFDRYLKLSTYSDYVKPDSGASAVIKIEKLLYRVLPKAMFLYIFKIMHGGFYRKSDKLSKENKISSRM